MPATTRVHTCTRTHAAACHRCRAMRCVCVCVAGQYLLLFYNNLGRAGEGRNPYWLAAGIEAGGEILWSAPEIILYDRYHSVPEAGGYPDFIQDPEEESKIYIMETNKKVARLHLIEEATLTALFTQHSRAVPAADPSANFSSCAFVKPGHSCEDTVKIPRLTSFETVHRAQQGFSIELSLAWHAGSAEGDVVFDARGKKENAASLRHSVLKNDRFAKTGSGQT
jgi:hypothetical protein